MNVQRNIYFALSIFCLTFLPIRATETINKQELLKQCTNLQETKSKACMVETRYYTVGFATGNNCQQAKIRAKKYTEIWIDYTYETQTQGLISKILQTGKILSENCVNLKEKVAMKILVQYENIQNEMKKKFNNSQSDTVSDGKKLNIETEEPQIKEETKSDENISNDEQVTDEKKSETTEENTETTTEPKKEEETTNQPSEKYDDVLIEPDKSTNPKEETKEVAPKEDESKSSDTNPTEEKYDEIEDF